MERKGIFLRYFKNEAIENVRSMEFIIFLFIIGLFSTLILNRTDKMENVIPSFMEEIFYIYGILTAVFFTYISAKTYAKEFEQRTMNVLLTSPITRTQVYIAKIMAVLWLLPIITSLLMVVISLNIISNGRLPIVEYALLTYRVLIFMLFNVSVIILTFFISAMTRKSSLSMLVIILMIVLALPYGSGMHYLADTYEINYPIVFLSPMTCFITGLQVTSMFKTTDLTLICVQGLFVLVFLIIGLSRFRRMEIWG